MKQNDKITPAETADEKSAAFYDSYNYATFWDGRDYEHHSDAIALVSFLKQNKTNHNLIIDVGGGLGRLAPYYAPAFKEAVLLDPSVVQLERTKSEIGETYPNLSFVRGIAQNLPFPDASVDTIVCVRVSHHIPDFADAIKEYMRVLSPGGYLILEIANKMHIKARINALLKGESKKINSEAPIKVAEDQSKYDTPFVNHNPNRVKRELEKAGFKILDTRSASNFRSQTLKKIIPKKALIFFDKILQKPLSYIKFGPSIYFLARKNKAKK